VLLAKHGKTGRSNRVTSSQTSLTLRDRLLDAGRYVSVAVMWQPHLWHFLGQVWLLVLSWHSATTFSVVRDILIVPAVIALGTLRWKLGKAFWRWGTLISQGTDVLKSLGISIVGLLGLLAAVFVFAIPFVVYQDHMDLVFANKRTTDQLTTEREKAKASEEVSGPITKIGPKRRRAHLTLFHGFEKLDGDIIDVPLSGNILNILLSLRAKNDGGVSTPPGVSVSVRLYFSRFVEGPSTIYWQNSESEEPDFPVAFFWGGANTIGADETWVVPIFGGQIVKDLPTDPFRAKVKMFYGDEHADAVFTLRPIRSSQ
jgi:hypothetical protein